MAQTCIIGPDCGRQEAIYVFVDAKHNFALGVSH